MIDIYLHSRYSKDKLKFILKAIRDFSPRELTYDFRNPKADVRIEELLGDDIDVFESIVLDYPNAINILVGDSGYSIVYQNDFLTINGLSIAIKEVVK
ncbi:terminal repeat-encoded protein [Staphylococcus phage phiSA12]|uniref:Terminal repeat-encoded protein n=1 Tax=Staphylococcus phage phiSA12 TaxID=1450142 RepID=W0TXW4_9CAUD|nr:terminal repeat-encoded protein [Staphylococcus phage phiSA12]BAO47239.1 terminal repeat-encoded protein [Staphylococcus phage phiSA12]